jgi:hypothetical protein
MELKPPKISSPALLDLIQWYSTVDFSLLHHRTDAYSHGLREQSTIWVLQVGSTTSRAPPPVRIQGCSEIIAL